MNYLARLANLFAPNARAGMILRDKQGQGFKRLARYLFHTRATGRKTMGLNCLNMADVIGSGRGQVI